MLKIKYIKTIFVMVTLILTWMIWILGDMFYKEHISVFITIGTLIPSIVGLFLLYILNKQKLIESLKSGVSFHISFKNFLFIFLTIPFISLISYLIMVIFHLDLPDVSYQLYELPIVFIVIMFTMGPVGEEFGWRGLLANQMMKQNGVLKTSLTIGLIWSLWHLPLFFIKDALQYTFVSLYGFIPAFLGYLIYTLLLSIFITILYQRTKYKLSSAIFIHTIANMTIGVMPLVFNYIGAIIYISLMFVVISSIYILDQKGII